LFRDAADRFRPLFFFARCPLPNSSVPGVGRPGVAL